MRKIARKPPKKQTVVHQEKCELCSKEARSKEEQSLMNKTGLCYKCNNFRNRPDYTREVEIGGMTGYPPIKQRYTRPPDSP